MRDELRAATDIWVNEVATASRHAAPHTSPVEPKAAAHRLTSLVEGLSIRWLSGSLSLEDAQALLREAVSLEIGTAAAQRPR